MYVAFPRSDYYAPSDCLLGLGVFVGGLPYLLSTPLRIHQRFPVFSIEDSVVML